MPSPSVTGDAERLEFVEQQHQVPQVASEPVQPPDEQHVEAAALRIMHQCIQGRPRLTSATNAVVHVLADAPATRGGVGPQLLQLVL